MEIEINLSNGFRVEDLVNREKLLSSLNDDTDFLITTNYIIPKVNIDCIKLINNEEIEEI